MWQGCEGGLEKPLTWTVRERWDWSRMRDDMYIVGYGVAHKCSTGSKIHLLWEHRARNWGYGKVGVLGKGLQGRYFGWILKDFFTHSKSIVECLLYAGFYDRCRVYSGGDKGPGSPSEWTQRCWEDCELAEVWFGKRRLSWVVVWIGKRRCRAQVSAAREAIFCQKSCWDQLS